MPGSSEPASRRQRPNALICHSGPCPRHRATAIKTGLDPPDTIAMCSGREMTKPQAITYPAFDEVRQPDGTTVFVTMEEMLRSPVLQERCVDKRRFRSARHRLRKAGCLNEVSYVGP